MVDTSCPSQIRVKVRTISLTYKLKNASELVIIGIAMAAEHNTLQLSQEPHAIREKKKKLERRGDLTVHHVSLGKRYVNKSSRTRLAAMMLLPNQ